MAKIGVQLFSIPAYPDEIPVSAYVNKNAGKKLPQNPTIASFPKVFQFLSNRIFLSANGKRASAAINILNAPTWTSLKIGIPSTVNMAFFINMNELPQIIARKTSKIQLIVRFDMRQMYGNFDCE